MSSASAAVRRPGWSVRSRILATILAAALMGLVAAGVVSYELQRARMVSDVDARLSSELAEARRLVAAQHGIASTGQALRRVLSIAVPPEDGGTVGILDGRTAYTSGVSEAVRPERLPGFAARVFRETADGSVRQGTYLHDGVPYRYLAVPVTVAADPARGVFAVVIDQSRRLAPLDSTFRVYAIISLGALLVIGVLGWLVAGRLLAPIRGLNRMAQRITADDLGERIPVTGDDDVSTLTGTVNSMLDRIQEGVEQRRALLEDVRHELKAPLSVIRGELELLVAGDEQIVADARRIGIEEVDRMTALVDGLTDLTDVQTSVFQPATVDLGALTDDMLARCSALGGRPWRISTRAAASWTLDRERIIQAWLQLAQNADKYSPAGRPIELGSSVTDGEAWMWVADQGTPIPLEERAAVFERFVRGRGSASSNGSGLGLAIVSAIAAAHGGRVELEADTGGNTFSLVIPAGTETP
ncbi:sensor histidine kinase [Pseudolysinimonas sp.]|uniref:sensor histidine kinase n=1 Tax=Pseudolysinimonas sp. TaxID=2680009 RepID=UPI003F7CF9D6